MIKLCCLISVISLFGGKTESGLPAYTEERSSTASEVVDTALVRLMAEVAERDVKYRGKSIPDWAAHQRPLDSLNQRIIDSLYAVHQTYIGKSLVGDRYEYVMWSVIQHSEVSMMERYLPVLAQAARAKELSVIPFKMFLDRYYGLKFGYQIFGTQQGFGFEKADAATRRAIEVEYGLGEK